MTAAAGLPENLHFALMLFLLFDFRTDEHFITFIVNARNRLIEHRKSKKTCKISLKLLKNFIKHLKTRQLTFYYRIH